jgi:tRNA-splicing ligase RtcB
MVNEVRVEGGIPVKSWGSQIEEVAWEQAINLSQLPFAQKWIALMPDAHPGYGMPIGGVLFADKAIIPYAVGVDIGCGVTLIETDMHEEQLEDKVPAFLHQISRDVPVGNGPHAQHKELQGDRFLPPHDEEISDVASAAVFAAETQLGTLGGGNHFLELQRSEDGQIWFMLHSGSRSVGKKICDHWHKVALGLNQKWFSKLPDKELAYLPWGTEEAQGYFGDMLFAMRWAEENRRRMTGKVVSAFGRIFDAKAWQVCDIHHNYAAWENHFNRNGIVHRKGAVKAGIEDMVLIPGSMGTASYVGKGLGNPDSFESCQHGAGRARSRGDTRRMTNLEAMDLQMAQAHVTLVTPDRTAVIDESSIAYKDIEIVMVDSVDLVTPTMKLRPVGVVKG